jgi:hypothetical protein
MKAVETTHTFIMVIDRKSQSDLFIIMELDRLAAVIGFEQRDRTVRPDGSIYLKRAVTC